MNNNSDLVPIILQDNVITIFKVDWASCQILHANIIMITLLAIMKLH